mmetsp:Transcript_3355/g.6972  ORF Transcript_3355/g.6972 Transcript_3355/m.6972 type:complete len:241 (+) Transcript_3355:637-1359(+)
MVAVPSSSSPPPARASTLTRATPPTTILGSTSERFSTNFVMLGSEMEGSSLVLSTATPTMGFFGGWVPSSVAPTGPASFPSKSLGTDFSSAGGASVAGGASASAGGADGSAGGAGSAFPSYPILAMEASEVGEGENSGVAAAAGSTAIAARLPPRNAAPAMAANRARAARRLSSTAGTFSTSTSKSASKSFDDTGRAVRRGAAAVRDVTAGRTALNAATSSEQHRTLKRREGASLINILL